MRDPPRAPVGSIPGGHVVIDGVLFIAARNARSQAYAQAMVRAGLVPAHTLLLEPGPAGAGSAPCIPVRSPAVLGVEFPDLAQALETTLAQAGCPYEILHTSDVNDGKVLAALERFRPRLVIYSGYGGQLVGPPLLDLGIPFLHLHSGWLPEFRGSTTLYYALLTRQPPAVSAIVLDRHIDEGRILLRRRYPVPPSGCEIDLIYDNAIRADLLVRVLRRHQRAGGLWSGRPQRADAGRSYYVIHPVLKHIARLSLHEDAHA